jgi:hypothetical protein
MTASTRTQWIVPRVLGSLQQYVDAVVGTQISPMEMPASKLVIDTNFIPRLQNTRKYSSGIIIS